VRKLRDVPGESNRASLEMYLEAMMVQACRPRLSKFGDTLGGQDRVKSDIQMEAMPE
jgi:hypothetical protein